MAISSIQDQNQALLQSIYGSSGSEAARAPSLSSIIGAAVSAQEERKANRELLTDQAFAIGDLLTRADRLRDTASELNNAGGKRLNLFRDGASNADVKVAITDFTSAFNDFKTFATDNRALFSPQLNQTVSRFVDQNRTSLADIGITVDSSGLLSVDETLLDEALTDNFATVESALGGLNGLATRANFFAADLRATPSFQLLSNLEVPERPSFAVDLLREEQFQGAILNLLR